MTHRALLIFALIFLGMFGLSPANAGDGVVNGVKYRPLPASPSLRVDPLDNSADNMVLKAEFEHLLRSDGFNVSDTATLVFSFEVRDEIGSWGEGDNRTVLELTSRGGKSGGENAKAKLNLFNSSDGALLNPGRGKSSLNMPTRYKIEATLDDRSNGKRLWQGWVTGDLGMTDTLTLKKNMVPYLSQVVGKTVTSKTIILP